MVFDLGGHNFTLTPYGYTLEMMMGDYGFRCLTAFQPWDTRLGHIDIIVLGSAFLRAFYSVLNFDNKQFGCKFSTGAWHAVGYSQETDAGVSLVAPGKI